MIACHQDLSIRRQRLHGVSPGELEAVPDTIEQPFVYGGAIGIALIGKAAPEKDRLRSILNGGVTVGLAKVVDPHVALAKFAP